MRAIKAGVREGRNDCSLWMEQKESEREGHYGKHSTNGVIKIKCISMAADKSYGLPTGPGGFWSLTAKQREKLLRLFELPGLHECDRLHAE